METYYSVLEVDENNHILVKEPNEHFIANGQYTYADYYKWKIEERVELIKGWIVKLSAPNLKHQSVSMRLSFKIYQFLQNKACKVFAAPFDVRLTKKNNCKETEITTVVQPDIVVVCNEENLDEKGCIGSPDLVIEILSSSNNKYELKRKFNLYEEHLIKEYWIVNPAEENIIVYSLESNKYVGSRFFTDEDLIKSKVLMGINIKAQELFI